MTTKPVHPLSLTDVDFQEFVNQSVQFFTHDDFVMIMNVWFYRQPFLKPNEVYRITESRLILLLEGHAQASINLQDYAVSQGSLVLLAPDAIVELKEVSDNVRVIAMVLGEEVKVKQDVILYNSPTEFEHFLRLSYLAWDMAHCQPYRHETVYHLLHAIVANALQLDKQQKQSEAQSQPARLQALFQEFRRLVAQHATQHRTVNFYAQALHITPHYLSAVIKKASNQSVMQWVHRALVQEAKLLLQANELMLFEIAYRLNFPSASAFTKFFKRETGITPTQYQEQTTKGP